LQHFARHGCSIHNKSALEADLSGFPAEMARDPWRKPLGVFLDAAVAGARAMQAAGRGLIRIKGDGTPHAAADIASDQAIAEVLAARLKGLPVVSEESRSDLPKGFAEGTFILVDPLDGTREFLEGHPDHAVCIALIEQRRPMAGVILAPQRRKAWIAGEKAFEIALDADLELLPSSARPLTLDSDVEVPNRMVTSRSRPDPMARRMFPDLPEESIRRVGAVLKLVAIATGEACVFPTSNPSSEWDIAAGEALVRAAGGVMLGRNGKPLIYGRKSRGFVHEPYVAACNLKVARLALSQWPAC
jgi:3'(2'), 5'-bisphosphate nucleotidase